MQGTRPEQRRRPGGKAHWTYTLKQCDLGYGGRAAERPASAREAPGLGLWIPGGDLPGRRVSGREGPATANRQVGAWPGRRPAVGVRVGTAGPVASGDGDECDPSRGGNELAGPSRPRREAPVRTSGNVLGAGAALIGTTPCVSSWG